MALTPCNDNMLTTITFMLYGMQNITMPYGFTYAEPGHGATDNMDGNSNACTLCIIKNETKETMYEMDNNEIYI